MLKKNRDRKHLNVKNYFCIAQSKMSTKYLSIRVQILTYIPVFY